MCIEIYKPYPAKFILSPGLAWKADLKKTKVKFDLLTDIDMLITVEAVLEEEYFTLFINMPKLITNT